jgi:NAD+ synthase (glutamine-hydrolysing)
MVHDLCKGRKLIVKYKHNTTTTTNKTTNTPMRASPSARSTPSTATSKSTPPVSFAPSSKQNERTPDLVVLPETCIQGYTSLDWFLDRDVQRCALATAAKIIDATEGITAIVGTVGHRICHRPPPLQLRRHHSQSETARLCRQDALLPEYDVFDDPRYFQPAPNAICSRWRKKLGVAVCEDFWNDKTFWRERLYANDPADELIELGAEVLISINASPFNKGKMGQRCAMVSHRAMTAKIPIVFVNLVGGNDGVIFDGASIVADAQGKIILQAPPFEEFIGTVDLDCDVADKRCLPGDDVETIHDALVLGIRDYARKNGFKRVVLGLSGGIDSAVVAALACQAIGAENVLSVMMPSPYSSRSSIDDSVELGRRLGMPVIEHPITNATKFC